MPKKLAQALMEAGMQHFDVGGSVAALGGDLGPLLGMNTYSASGPTGIDQKNLANQSDMQYGQQQDVYGQQQGLSNQLLAQTQGQGPGQQMVNQQASQLGAQQAATMASARGANVNPALAARQAAMMGQQGQQQALNSQAALQLQSQSALAQQQAQMANQSLQGRSITQGAIGAQNNAVQQAQATNAQISAQNAKQSGGIFGNLMGGLSSALGGLFHDGGQVPSSANISGIPNYSYQHDTQKLAMGGPVDSFLPPPQNPIIGIPSYGPMQIQPMKDYDTAEYDPESASKAGGQLGKFMKSSMSSGAPAAGGGAMPAMAVANGGQIPFGQMLAGGNVQGQAQVQGDSADNDTVPTMLSPGEIVIPRSIAQAPDAEKKAAEFIAHLKKKKPGYDAVVEARKGK